MKFERVELRNHVNLLNVEGFRLKTDMQWWNKRGVFEPNHLDDYLKVLIDMDKIGLDHPEMNMLKRIEA